MSQMKTVSCSIAALLIIGTAQAVRVQRLSLSEIRDQASSIIVARVISQETRLGPDAKMVWTDYQLEVEEVLLGADQPEVKTLSFAGGEAAGKEVGITGVPRLGVGRRYVLFLLPSGTPWATPTVGWAQGIFEVVPRRSTEEGEVLISYDGEPLEMTSGGLRRGGLVRRTDDWIGPFEAPASSRAERELEPVVLDADGNRVEQPPPSPEPEVMRLDQRSFASLDQLRDFLLGIIEEDRSGNK